MVDQAVKGYWPRVLKKQLFFVAGTIFYATLPFYLSLMFCLLFTCRHLRRYGVIFFLSYLCCCMFQVLFFPRPIPNTALNREIQLKGHIESLRYQGLRSQSFIFVIRQLNKQPLYSRVILTDYQKKITVKAGMELELTAKLKPFAVFHNDGGRDWLKQMYFKRLFAKGYLIHIEKPLGTKRAPFIKRLREYCLRRIQILSMAKESQGLVESLTLGVRHNLSNAWREVFRATGTGHLIAISGLHVGLFAYAAYKLFFFLWCLSARLCERVPAQRAAAVAAIIFAFFYVALTNFSVSALRAFIMIALVMVAKIIGRRPYLWDIFFTALVLVLFINPYSIYNYGFYLSFYAVFIIFSFVGDGEIKLVKLQFIISLLMLPISLYFFLMPLYHRYPQILSRYLLSASVFYRWLFLPCSLH